MDWIDLLKGNLNGDDRGGGEAALKPVLRKVLFQKSFWVNIEVAVALVT